ncbi:MAG TPA: DUF2097 domain-containing protein [Methanothermococcus okinawensis]|uniref:DUF2097 domain-containing protein n=1 Tax=Methanothermococcus okinawensis TaxID=155863 RepID=A0A832ZA38_9EURY|nr:DUF2097 domain-containing protein [Methanothermococcus okinawensis]HIP91484.1 DUF2097 domain-containing protein [Methanothermococcus okinawensis]
MKNDIEILINSKDELYRYLEDIEEGDYFEAYFGRYHVEGVVILRDETFFKLDTNRELMGIIDFEVKEVLPHLIEVAYTKSDGIRRVLKLVE